MAALTFVLHVNAQIPDWSTQGNTVNTNEWFGADVNSTIPLQIRHDAGDQPIEFYTTGDGISEMWLTPILTNFFFSTTFPNLDLSGNLGVGPGFSAAIPPLSRLHLNAAPYTAVTGYTPGYRDWMRTGLTCTEGRDGMYVGLKNEGSVFSNPAVINWSSNVMLNDPLKFIFTCSPNGPGVQADPDGLEIARNAIRC